MRLIIGMAALLLATLTTSANLTLEEVESAVRSQQVDIVQYNQAKEQEFRSWYNLLEPNEKQARLLNQAASDLSLALTFVIIDTVNPSAQAKEQKVEHLVFSRLPIALVYGTTVYVREDWLSKASRDHLLLLVAHEYSHDQYDSLVREYLLQLSREGKISDSDRALIRMQQEQRADLRAYELLVKSGRKTTYKDFSGFWKSLVADGFAVQVEADARLKYIRSLFDSKLAVSTPDTAFSLVDFCVIFC